MTIDQIGIPLFGTLGVICSQQASFKVRRWHSVFGLMAWPFWAMSTYSAQQWGTLAMSIVYGSAYLYGFYINWLKRSNCKGK